MGPFLPAIGTALVGTIVYALGLRRLAFVVMALLPIHTAAASWKVNSTSCNLGSGSFESCERGLTVPVDLLWAHVAFAAVCLAVVLVQVIGRAWHAASPRTATQA